MIFAKVLFSISNLAFPPLCLHCDKKTEPGHFLLCHSCISSFEFLDPKDYCQYCFRLSEEPICFRCQNVSGKLFQQRMIFKPTDCLLSLVREVSTHRFLTDSIAALCVYGYLQSSEAPHVLTSLSCKLCESVAKQMAKWMQVRYVKLTKVSSNTSNVVLFQLGDHRLNEVKRQVQVHSVRSVLSMTRLTGAGFV